jgi:hypothetical protein
VGGTTGAAGNGAAGRGGTTGAAGNGGTGGTGVGGGGGTLGPGDCGPYPVADSLCGGTMPPNAYRCIFPAPAPANCTLRQGGNVTSIYCCP